MYAIRSYYAHEEGLETHVHHSSECGGGVVRVDRREYEVTRERRLDGDGSRVDVSNLTDHDDVGILAKERLQGRGEASYNFV